MDDVLSVKLVVLEFLNNKKSSLGQKFFFLNVYLDNLEQFGRFIWFQLEILIRNTKNGFNKRFSLDIKNEFFDWICRNMFSRRLIATSSTPATAASSSTDSAAALQATKQLIDLVLVISQQTLLMNVSFVAHLNEYLQEQSINNVSLFHSLHSGLNLSHLNPAGLEFYNLILESNYFHSFIQTVLTDYRYLLNKKEIYEFMQIFLSYFIANPNKSVLSTAKGTTTNKSTSSMLLNLKGSQIFYFL